MMEKCDLDSDDIQAHLDEVVLMHECLSRMGVAMHDDDYSSIILMSLPKSLHPPISKHSQTPPAAAENPLTTHNLIAKAIDLYEKCQLCTRQDTKSGNKDSAFQASDYKGKGKKGTEAQERHRML